MQTDTSSQPGVALVTGGSGFLAGWLIRKLLERGRAVRMTVRTEAKANEVINMLTDEGVETTQLSWAIAELNSPEGWPSAMAGVDRLFHVASPLGGENHDDPALIDTAVAGVRNVVGAAIAARVPKVVMTSSAAAVFPGRKETRQDIDETYWTRLDDELVTQYMRSKTIAERTAWHLIDGQDTTQLVTILPGAIFGPFMAGRSSSTDVLFTTLLSGMPSPKATFQAVDVRDLAELHILAMDSAAADGHRFIAQPGSITMPQMATLLKETLGDAGDRVSTRTIPDFVIKIGAHFSPALRVMNTLVGMHHAHNTTKAQKLLGWTPRPLQESVVDTARYVIAREKGSKPA